MNLKEEINKYQFSTPIQLRYEEFDTFQHLNNIAYLSCFQYSRGPFMKAVAPNHSWEESPMVIASNLINYYSEVSLHMREVEVYVRFSAMGTKSITIDHMMVSKNPETQEPIVHAWCQAVLVRINMQTKKSVPIEIQFRQLVEDLLKE